MAGLAWLSCKDAVVVGGSESGGRKSAAKARKREITISN